MDNNILVAWLKTEILELLGQETRRVILGDGPGTAWIR